MIIVLYTWFILGAIGAIALGIRALAMFRILHLAELALPQALFFAAATAQHLAFVYLAGRAILGLPGPSGVLILTVTQALVTPASCWVALRLRGRARKAAAPEQEEH